MTTFDKRGGDPVFYWLRERARSGLLWWRCPERDLSIEMTSHLKTVHYVKHRRNDTAKTAISGRLTALASANPHLVLCRAKPVHTRSTQPKDRNRKFSLLQPWQQPG